MQHPILTTDLSFSILSAPRLIVGEIMIRRENGVIYPPLNYLSRGLYLSHVPRPALVWTAII